ncbi:MAG: GntR family transcriptional regulator [Akkermansiaceae bacterium]|nr:GntR family transcriptional regulator [Akkermansiaceae bacterium]NNM30828.1 GntR family transcriptional regulator [Akkermansiaceae bacterium]
MAEIGQWNTLVALEESDRGLLLDGGEHGKILAPSRYLPEDAEPGEEFKVFVYPDSEDRLIATTEQPLAQVGEFACLEVLSVHPRAGAFLDWGLAKDLLLPYAEQLGPVRAGQRVVVAVALDERSNRVIATMRTHRHLDRSRPDYHEKQAVDLLIAERTPLGFNAIVNQRHMGLLYHTDLAAPLQIGESMEGYVRAVRPDGKIDLGLDRTGYGRVKTLGDDILEALRNGGGYLAMGDKSPPEEIRQVFGTSKKAFKQALGALYKQRRIRFEGTGIRLEDGAMGSPAPGS